MRPWLLIMCGFPFSGKSTLAGEMAERGDMKLVSVDDLHERHGLNIESDTVHTHDWVMAYRSGYQDTERHLADGHSVVFDSVGFRRKDRDRLRRTAERFDADALVVWLDLPANLARLRLEGNRIKPIRPNVPIANFEQIVREFEPPEADETWVAYEPNEAIEQWVERVLRPALERQD